MPDRHHQEPFMLQHAKSGSRTQGTQEMDRRTAPRVPFVAEAQVLEIASGARLRGRSCDLTTNGCYVDTLNPFPTGTAIRLRLRQLDALMDVRGTVVYGQTGLGMGILFLDLSPEQQAMLEVWLTPKACKEHDFESSAAPKEAAAFSAAPPEPAVQVAELVEMLAYKRVISKDEAESILRKPLQ